jgi:hypothetical protein
LNTYIKPQLISCERSKIVIYFGFGQGGEIIDIDGYQNNHEKGQKKVKRKTDNILHSNMLYALTGILLPDIYPGPCRNMRPVIDRFRRRFRPDPVTAIRNILEDLSNISAAPNVRTELS